MNCDRCRQPFDVENEPGGLLFGPPLAGFCQKRHLCVDCYLFIEKKIDG